MSRFTFFKISKRKNSKNLGVMYDYIQENIVTNPKTAFTEKDKSDILDIYNNYYSSTHLIPAQRQTAHNTFITIYTFIISFFGYIIFSSHQEWLALDFYLKLFIIFLGDLFLISYSYVWYRTLLSYTNFNYMLISITRSLEPYLPVQPIDTLFKTSEYMKIPTNLAAEMSITPKLLAFLSVLTSVILLYM